MKSDWALSIAGIGRADLLLKSKEPLFPDPMPGARN